MEMSNRPIFIRTDRSVFFMDEELSDDLKQTYISEISTNRYRIVRVGNNGPLPYYELFHDYRERHNGKMRNFSTMLFCSSKIEKIINYINQNL